MPSVTWQRQQLLYTYRETSLLLGYEMSGALIILWLITGAYPVSVEDRDLLTDENISEEGHGCDQGGQGHLVVEGPQGQIVHLYTGDTALHGYIHTWPVRY